MVRRTIILSGMLLALLLAASACRGKPAYTNLSPAQLAEMLQAKDFYFVNTHVPYEGEIADTDAFIAYEAKATQRVDEYPADKDAKIVLYCRSGRMSETVAEALVQAGYTHVYNLDGGMIAWEEAGFPLVQR